MNIAGLFINRPVMTTLVMLAILLFGVMGYRESAGQRSAKRGLPDARGFGGAARRKPRHDGVVRRASAREAVLDDRRARPDDVERMESAITRSRFNSISAATSTPPRRTCRRRLPQPELNCRANMPSPAFVQKVNPADQPILYLALSSPTLPLSAVDEYAETFIAQRISMINGVAQVQVYGAQKYAVRVQLDPKALASRGDRD